jgi:hypothetical protein
MVKFLHVCTKEEELKRIDKCPRSSERRRGGISWWKRWDVQMMNMK